MKRTTRTKRIMKDGWFSPLSVYAMSGIVRGIRLIRVIRVLTPVDPLPYQATNGADRGPFVIQTMHKRARNGPDHSPNWPRQTKIRGTRTATRVKYPIFNRFPVPLMTW